MDTFKECESKSGVLYMIKHKTNTDEELNLIRVYVEANKDSISFYRAQQPSSLFFKVPTKNLEKIGYKFMGTFCFELNMANVENQKYKNNVISLCTTSKTSLRKWVKSLMEIPYCKNNVSGNINSNSNSNNNANNVATKNPVIQIGNIERILVEDFSKINQFSNSNLIKSSNVFQIENNDRAYPYHAPDIDVKETYIRHNLDALAEKIRESKIAEERQKRIYKEKFEKEKEKTKKVKEEKQLIYNLTKHRNIIEKQRAKKFLEMEFKMKESKIFNQTSNKIDEIEKQAIAKLKESYQEKVELEKQKNNIETLNMIKCFNEDNKLTEWSACVSLEVFKFQNKKYTDDLCSKYYGEENGDKCKTKKHFCTMCCDHHVGRKHKRYQVRCISVCKKIVRGKADIKKLKKHDDNHKTESIEVKDDKIENKEHNRVIQNLLMNQVFYR